MSFPLAHAHAQDGAPAHTVTGLSAESAVDHELATTTLDRAVHGIPGPVRDQIENGSRRHWDGKSRAGTGSIPQDGHM